MKNKVSEKDENIVYTDAISNTYGRVCAAWLFDYFEPYFEKLLTSTERVTISITDFETIK